MKEKKSFIKFLVILFPVGLLLMAVGSLFFYEMRRVDKQEEAPIAQAITAQALRGHYEKLEEYMTPRGYRSEEEVGKLVRTTAYIEGALSYLNTGLNLEEVKAHTEAGRVWKRYRFCVKGRKRGGRVYTFNYVTLSNEELACALMQAEALPNGDLKEDVCLEFSPVEGEGISYQELVEEGRRRGQGNALCYAGVDWGYLAEQLKEKGL